MNCKVCHQPTSGKHETCPKVCRSRHKVGHMPCPNPGCTRLMTKRSKQCKRCYLSDYRQKRKGQPKRPHVGRPPAPMEPIERVERLLAAVDAMKRRQRWAA